MDSIATLRALSDIIANAVTTVERTYKDAELSPPSLDEPFDHHVPAEALRRDPVVVAAIQNLVAAAGQITAVMRDPALYVLDRAHGFQVSSCIQAVSQLNVAEFLREAGPEGMSVKEIAARSSVDSKLLGEASFIRAVFLADATEARILRLLATHHIFREVSTDVFANNRISSTLDKGKSVDELLAKPDERLLETTGLSALVEFLSEEVFKASGFMAESFLDSSPLTPHMRAFKTDGNMFQWFENPDNKHRLMRFGIAMKGSAAEEPVGTIFKGFPWQNLTAGGVIVDVGGGLGATSLSIVKEYPTFKVVNQDRAPVIKQSKAHWQEFFPEYIEAGMVEFQPHNFLEAQPVKNASAFLLRHITHDWSDANLVIILNHLRAAALPSTKLVIIESIVAPACAGRSTHPQVNNIRILGVPRKSAPPPLLANFGVAAAPLYYYDLTMNNLLGGQERTLEGFYDVLLQSGWKLVEVYHCPETDWSHLVADPIF
ncbi:S-adenosyl-L-methionine-dependent methyltransferase [Mycena sanguinolenta]|uniref:S-adenosyl-L-methionine-dependent methyltransferase n=1 Tax=Mycena sanguinolenta TaxID=230812 RepID=A0A8H6XKE1_9AGAR|nr:S-adenosyl-L-methionine-dependent methyltransferase [Mycena sanguinolenta]